VSRPKTGFTGAMSNREVDLEVHVDGRYSPN
jgi:hypothetical protein